MSAIICLLVFSGWLQYHHGHNPYDGLFPGGERHTRAQVTPCAGSVHQHGGRVLTSHELNLIYPHGCPICALFNWNSEPQAQPELVKREFLLSLAPQVTGYPHPSLSRTAYRLRAPPLPA